MTSFSDRVPPFREPFGEGSCLYPVPKFLRSSEGQPGHGPRAGSGYCNDLAGTYDAALDLCQGMLSLLCHHGVIKWKQFPRYWPFGKGIHELADALNFQTVRPVTYSKSLIPKPTTFRSLCLNDDLTRLVLKPEYFGKTMSIPCLMMPLAS